MTPQRDVPRDAADILAERDERFRPQLESIGRSIGYGRSCQILGELWDDMLEREWGLPRGRGKMERRLDIEKLEAVIRAAPAAAPADPIRDALAALGVIGDGYCFCSENRDPHKSAHEPECRDARAALAEAPTAPLCVRCGRWPGLTTLHGCCEACVNAAPAAPAPQKCAECPKRDRCRETCYAAPAPDADGPQGTPRMICEPIQHPNAERTAKWLREWSDRDLVAAYREQGRALPVPQSQKDATLGYIAARTIDDLRATVEQQAREIAAMTAERDHEREIRKHDRVDRERAETALSAARAAIAALCKAMGARQMEIPTPIMLAARAAMGDGNG